jgi:hypothetical protein
MPISTPTTKKSRTVPWRRYVTPVEELLAQKYEGYGRETDPYIIDWLDGDVENPQNWKSVSRTLYSFLHY